MKVDFDKVSYVLGQSIGGDFRRQGFEINLEIFTESFTDAFNGKESKMRVSEMQHIMQNLQREERGSDQANRFNLLFINEKLFQHPAKQLLAAPF